MHIHLLSGLIQTHTHLERRLFKDRLKFDTRNSCFCSLVIWERWIKSIKREERRERWRESHLIRGNRFQLRPPLILDETLRVLNRISQMEQEEERCSNDQERISGSYLRQKEKRRESKSSLLSLSLWQGSNIRWSEPCKHHLRSARHVRNNQARIEYTILSWLLILHLY